MKKIKRALISVSNKNNIKKLLLALSKLKIELVSSGGTFKEIKKLKFKCTEVSKYTGSPEILDGRVKTLHPKIHGGILSKRNRKSHQKDLLKNNFPEIDLVVVNFYPFEKTLTSTSNHSKIIENIDIGGPAMLRSGAKNHTSVTVIVNNSDYKLYSYDDSLSVCFNYKDFDAIELCTQLYNNNKLMVGYGEHKGETFVRLVTINRENTKKDILSFFKILEDFSNKHL